MVHKEGESEESKSQNITEAMRFVRNKWTIDTKIISNRDERNANGFLGHDFLKEGEVMPGPHGREPDDGWSYPQFANDVVTKARIAEFREQRVSKEVRDYEDRVLQQNLSQERLESLGYWKRGNRREAMDNCFKTETGNFVLNDGSKCLGNQLLEILEEARQPLALNYLAARTKREEKDVEFALKDIGSLITIQDFSDIADAYYKGKMVSLTKYPPAPLNILQKLKKKIRWKIYGFMYNRR